MKKILSILLLGFSFLTSKSQTTPLTYTILTNDLNRPGGGFEQWNDQNIVNIPTQGTNTQRLDAYYRFQWIDIQPSASNGPGVGLSFTIFDQKVHAAIDAGQAFNFGVMQNCCSGPIAGGRSNGVFVDSIGSPPGQNQCCNVVYPKELHWEMQREAVRDWNNGGGWYENPNSSTWLAWWVALHQGIYTHILNTTYKGIRYRDVIKRIDARFIGDFGEQAVLNTGPTGTTPTTASIENLFDAIVNSYPTIQTTAMIGAFAAGVYGFTPAAAGAYELQKVNASGMHEGWRWDSWGWTDNIYHQALENNTNVVGGYHFDTAIMNRYKYAPVGGEPADLGFAGNFADLPVRITQYHSQGVGNGNLDQNNPPNATIQNNWRAASKAAGYRLVCMPTGGSITTSPPSGGAFTIVQHWQNQGACPTYQHWTVTYDFRATQNSTPAFVGTSSFDPFLYSPTGVDNVVTDNFTLTTVPAGTYQINMTVKDPLGYRQPMPVFITNTQQADGSYIIATNVVVTASGAVANAGPNQNIVISSVNLTAAASVGATSYSWTRISGPNTPTITTPTNVTTSVTGLINGTYVFQVCINGGPCSGQLISQVTVIVNAPPVQANAGNNQTITLPTSSVTLNGSGSTGATTYSWTNVSGPNTPTIVTPTTVSTSVTGLIQGTYVFQLSINSGASTSQVSVTVLPAPAPVANAGPSQTITLPTSSVNVNGSASTGTITSYAWTEVSGPNAAVFGTATSVSTTVSGLIEGTYIIRLTLNGGPATDTLQIVVNPAAPPVPTGQTIFTTQTTPTINQNDGPQGGITGIELGMKFRSSVNGFITGVRFWKTQGNTGTHIGELYIYPAGTRLGQVTFTNESLTGWQYAVFASPIAITAGQTYIIAYFSPNGFYTFTNNYFNTAVVNTPLTALADGTDGSNGVYKYTATPALPNATFQKSNYWVDVLFSAPTPPLCPCHPRYKGQRTVGLNGF